VAARKPKGLTAMIPWEGMSDYYRDRVRHGGILSNTFIKRWWDRQVLSNQYGLPGRAARNWGPDTIDGDLTEEQLLENRQDQTIDTAKYKFRDEKYFSSKDFDPKDIEVPLLSVANWVCSARHSSQTAFRLEFRCVRPILNIPRAEYYFTYVGT